MQRETQLANLQKQAQQLAASGDYSSAAAAYRNLAEKTQSPAQDSYRLLESEYLLKQGLTSDARDATTALDIQNLNQDQRYRLYLVYAQMELSAGKPEEALKNLDHVLPEKLNLENQQQYYRLQIQAHEQQGELTASSFDRIRMARLLPVTQSNQNTTAILDALLMLPQPDLLELQSSGDADVAAWADLTAIIEEQSANSATITQAVKAWQEQYPQLPIDISHVDQYAQDYQEGLKPPKIVAVLLPQSGPFADAAMAIRHGIMAAYYQSSSDGYSAQRPALRFYDTEADQPYALYQQAITEGADFVIGPLNKEKLQLLSESGELQIPVLALNEIPSLTAPNLYQFSLRPEDEVEQAASSAWFDGGQNALLMVPATGYGDRISSHFEDYWNELGGSVLEKATYASGQSDFSETIKQLLDLDESEQRYQQLRRIVPGIEFEPHRRDDADFIFLLASAAEARMIRPQLQFFHASKLPVYATSQVYSGQPQPEKDQDLSDIIFCDIPWLFEIPGSTTIEPTISALKQVWPATPDAYLRLTALGVDAYNLIPHLRRLQNLPDSTLAGTSGTLSLGRDRHINRQLYCAQFQDGIAQPRGWAPHLRPAMEQSEFPQAETTPVYEP